MVRKDNVNLLNPRRLSLCEDFNLSNENDVDWTDTMSDSDSNAEIDYMRGMSLSLCQERRSVTLTPPGFSDDTVKGLNMMWEDDGNTPNNDKCSYILDRKTLTVYKAYPGIIMAPVTFVMGAPDVDFIGMMRESKTWERYFGKMNITPKDRLRFISDCVMSLPPQQAVAKDHILNVMPDIDIDCDADEEFEFEFNLADNISAMVHRTNTIGAVNSWTGYTEMFAPAADRWFGFFLTESDAYNADGTSNLSDIGVFGSFRITNMFDRIPSEFGMEHDTEGRYKLFWYINGVSDYILNDSDLSRRCN